jgi:outer membrane protein TolC
MAAQDNVAIARAKLFQAANLPDDKEPLSGKLPSDWSSIHTENLVLKPEARSDRQVRVLNEESAARMASASRAHWYPQVSLVAGSEWYNNDNHSLLGDSSRYKSAYDVGLNLSWSLFDGGSSLASDRIAANARLEAAQKLKSLDDQIPVDFELWKRRLRYSVAAYEARTSAIKKAEESIRLAKSGVRAGTRTNTEILDAELELNQSRARAVKAQIDAVEALSNLEIALGTQIQ